MTTETVIPDGVPAWLAESPDERDELVALGILEAADVGQLKAISDYDALASKWLRAKARVLYDREQRQAALERELAQVTELYQAEFTKLARREQFIDETLAIISRAAPIPGGKKSRTVGFGTYGMRAKPATVEITDQTALTAWAKEQLPSACRVSLRLEYPFVRTHMPEQLVTTTGAPRAVDVLPTALTAHFEATGEEIPGATYVPKHDEPYFKPATVSWEDDSK
jgi:hypothetical protein